MKKYFAKWVKVSEEESDREYGLCLCTRELRKFDKVRVEDIYGRVLISLDFASKTETNYNFYPKEPENTMEMHVIPSAHVKDCYRVIGQISSKALWVEDGDEFNEDDVARKFPGMEPIYFSITEWEKQLAKAEEAGVRKQHENSVYPRIYMKCHHCGTFI